MKLKGTDSETGNFDMTCLRNSIVSATVDLLHGDVVGFKDTTTENELALMSALNQQPVSIVIEADQSFSHLYKTGVLGSCSPCPSSSKPTSPFPNGTRQACLGLAARVHRHRS